MVAMAERYRHQIVALNTRVRAPLVTLLQFRKKFLRVSEIHVLVIKDTPMHSITKSTRLTTGRPLSQSAALSRSWCISGMALCPKTLVDGVDSLTPVYPASREPKFATRNQEAGT